LHDEALKSRHELRPCPTEIPPDRDRGSSRLEQADDISVILTSPTFELHEDKVRD